MPQAKRGERVRVLARIQHNLVPQEPDSGCGQRASLLQPPNKPHQPFAAPAQKAQHHLIIVACLRPLWKD